MNGTRTSWSKQCCRYRHHEEYVFIISTCLVLIVTVLFYSLAKLLIDKKSSVAISRKLLERKPNYVVTNLFFSETRFAESLSHSRKD